MKRILGIVTVGLIFLIAAKADKPRPITPSDSSVQDAAVIPKGAKLFIAPMPDNFHEYIRAAIDTKKVPVTLVEKREDADFEMTGYTETEKAGVAKILIMGSWHSKESASVKVANLKSGTVVFAYSYNNSNSAHGKKSSSESCAKHLKEKIESGK